MEQATQLIIWWAGAFLCISALGYISGFALGWMENKVAKRLLNITRIVTAHYWVSRMEKEGLTVCMKDYRRMVAERNPRDLKQFKEISNEWEANQKDDSAEAKETTT